ncbi:MAG: EAL domain-containing protein [Rhodoferax sp.]
MLKPQILVLEPDDALAGELTRVLARLGYGWVAAADGPRALACASDSRPDLAILGLDFGAVVLDIAELLRREFKLPLLLVGECIDPALVERFKALTPDGFLTWPVHDHSLGLAIELAMHRTRLERERELATLALADSEAQFRGIFASAAEGVVVSSAEGTILLANPRAELLLGYASGELAGLPVEAMLPERLRETHTRMRERYRLQPQSRPMGTGLNILARRKDGSEFPADVALSWHKTSHGMVVVSILQDISARVRAEAELRRLNRMLRVLSAGNEALVRAHSEGELVQAVCDAIIRMGEYPAVWVARVGERPQEPPQVLAWSDACGEDKVCWAGDAACSLLAAVQAGGGPQVLREGDGLRCEAAQQRGYAAAVLLPLKKGDETFGVLGLFSAQADAFNGAEVELLVELADDLAFGIAAQRSDLARRQAEARLRLFERAVDSSANGIMISEVALPDHPIVYVNPAFERITGYSAAEVLGRNGRFLLGGDLEQRALEELRSALRQRRESRVELRNYRSDGTLFWNELSVAPVKSGDGVSHYVGVIDDVSERKRYEVQLEHQATHDALTGLPNRVLLLDRLTQAMIYSERSGRCAAALLLDLDRFKDVNDSLGHGAGDQVLLAAARRLLGCVREGDTVARLGGDEFVVVLADVAQEEDVAALARKILATLSKALSLGAQAELFPSASLGAALFPRDGDTPEILLKNADVAMYRAKERGGNAVSFYAPEMETWVRRRLHLEVGLRRALEQQEFVLHYQPQVDLGSGRIIGAEALLRWIPREGEMVPPDQFIPVAEKTGLILPIGRWVFAAAADQLRAWLDAGLVPVPVAVNLSARQFQEPELARLLGAELIRAGLESRWLELEITESALMDNLERAQALLREFKALGLRISLDDFGTGYSSLSYLKRLPFDTVKIDRAFIQELTSKPEDAAIVRVIIGMAHSLGLKVIAEGVETEAQLGYLRSRNCDALQGYLFSKAVSASEFAALLQEERSLPIGAAAAERHTVLLVDDERNVLTALQRLLRRDGYRILVATSGAEGLEIMARESVQVVVSDQRMPQMSGTDFLNRVRQIHPEMVRIILSGYTDLETVTRAVNQGGIFRLLYKPWDEEGLRETLREAFLLYQARQDSAAR